MGNILSLRNSKLLLAVKKRILFMHQASSIGGGSYCLLNIVKSIDRTYFDPLVVLKTQGPLVDELQKIGVEVVLFGEMSSIPYNSPLYRPFSVSHYYNAFTKRKKLKQILIDKKIDILYLNNMMIYPYLKIAKSIGVKTVIHIREHWPLNQHRHQLELARKNVYKYADQVIAINRYSASMFPEAKSTIVYDWIDMSNRYKDMPFNDIFKEDVSNKKVLLYTGGFDPIKGVYTVVETFTKHIVGNDYRLLMLGTPPDNNEKKSWKDTLRDILNMFKGGQKNIDITTMIGSDSRIKCIPAVYELEHLISQSTCFISYFSMPHANLALAENIILGNACIAAKTEESEEYALDGKAAKLVAFGNKEVFKIELLKFLNDIERWTEASQISSKKVATMFAPKQNIERLNKALLMLLS